MLSIRHALVGATALILAACATPAVSPEPTLVVPAVAAAAEKPVLIEFYADW